MVAPLELHANHATGSSNNAHISEFDSAHATMWLVLPQKSIWLAFHVHSFKGGNWNRFVVGMGSAIVEEFFLQVTFEFSMLLFYNRALLIRPHCLAAGRLIVPKRCFTVSSRLAWVEDELMEIRKYSFCYCYVGFKILAVPFCIKTFSSSETRHRYWILNFQYL